MPLKASMEPLPELATFREPFADHFLRSEGREDLERYSTGGEAGRPDPYEAIGRELGWNTEKVRKTLHRARRRFNVMLRETIREYVATDEEVEGELSDLRRHFR